jgi:hypothetical protein
VFAFSTDNNRLPFKELEADLAAHEALVAGHEGCQVLMEATEPKSVVDHVGVFLGNHGFEALGLLAEADGFEFAVSEVENNGGRGLVKLAGLDSDEPIFDMVDSANTVLAAQLAGGLALALAAGLALLPAKSTAREAYLGLWSGGCFAIGLTIGGMVRPSVVLGALGPAAFDGTLWVLFCTALATTFVAFRVAARVGVQEASVWGAASPAPVDRALLIGSVFFGVGWGATGLCPGPLLVGVGAAPGAPGLLLVLLTVSLGMVLSDVVLRKAVLGKAVLGKG